MTYTRTAVALHWLVAILIFTTFPLGLYMTDLSFSPEQLKLYSYHKWLGVTIAALVIIRIVWRMSHTPPPLPDSTPQWQKKAAQITHLALYGLMLAIPISGWLMSSAKGVPTVWLGWVPLPDLVEKSKPLGETLESIHSTLNYALLALVCAHIGAAFKHHYIDRDGLLLRMSFSKKRSTQL